MSDRGQGPVRLADRVAWLDLAERGQDAVYASSLPGGPPIVLRATAALIFVVAAAGGTVDEVVGAVAEAADQPAEAIQDDVVRFIDELVELGLLRRG